MTHPVQAALTAHAKACCDLKIKSIVDEPNRADAYNLADELEVFAKSADRVLLAFGEYARSTLGISRETVERQFRDCFFAAIDGEATHEITEAVEERISRRAEDRAETVAEFRRA